MHARFKELLEIDFALYHYNFSHEIRNTPRITSKIAAILRGVIFSTSFNKTAESNRMKFVGRLTQRKPATS